jgi:predicted lipid-binding transport protein (Tim44 family)
MASTHANTTINKITCTVGRYEGSIGRYSNDIRAKRVVKAWGGPLFKGAAFEVIDLNGSRKFVDYIALASLYGLTVSRRHVTEAAAARAERLNPRAAPAPAAPAAPAPEPTAPRARKRVAKALPSAPAVPAAPSPAPAPAPAAARATARVRWGRRFFGGAGQAAGAAS